MKYYVFIYTIIFTLFYGSNFETFFIFNFFFYQTISGHEKPAVRINDNGRKKNKLKDIKLRLHPEIYTEIDDTSMGINTKNKKRLIAVDLPYSLARLDPLSLNISTSLYNKQLDYSKKNDEKNIENENDNEKNVKKNLLKKRRGLPSGLVEVLGEGGDICEIFMI